MKLKTILIIISLLFLLAIIIQRLCACGLNIQSCNWADWTGLGAFTAPNENYSRGKTLWDWLDLLIVPILIAIGVWWLNKSQEQTKLRIEADKQRQTTLETYFDKMSELVSKLIPAITTNQTNEISIMKSIIRTRTLTLMKVMDENRKGQALQFIYELDLLGKICEINLKGADLNDADLSPATLENAKIKSVFAKNVNLKNSNLKKADFTSSDFSNSDLTDTNLEETNFTNTDLSNVKFINANLTKTVLTNAIVNSADFKGATFNETNLQGVDLRKAMHLTKDMLNNAINVANENLPEGLK